MTDHGFIPYAPARRSQSEMQRRAADFLHEMAARRSVRDFSADPVPREFIEQAILTACSAPSGAHRQPWQFVAVGDPEIKAQIRQAAEAEERATYDHRMPQEWRAALEPIGTDWQKPYLETAPWLVVCFEQTFGILRDGGQQKNYYVKESVGIACGLFIAALHNMGLSTVTHTPSPMTFLNDILNRPSNERPYVLFPIGYPADDCLVPDLQRKSLTEVSTWLES